MKISLCILLITLSTTTFATVLKTEQKGSSKIIYHDYNDDKKVDLIETFEKNTLVKKVQDVNFDGEMDETTDYFYHTKEDSPFEIVTKKDRRKKSYRHEKLKKIISTTEIDTDGDGKYDKTITDNYPLVQEADPCYDQQKKEWTQAEDLSKAVSRATRQINGGFVQNEMGYKIHQSCMENYGSKDFSKLVTTTMSKGLACLNDLAKKNTKQNPTAPNGALLNFKNLTRLLEKEKVTIVCHQTDYKWDGVAAHASTGPSDNIESLKVNHPYISMAPKYPVVKGRPTEKEITNASQTLFHEQLHNLGIVHGEGVEYPYSCEKCCLGSKDEYEGVVDAACKVCGGQYDMSKGVSQQYLLDTLTWGERSFDKSKAERAVAKYQKENSKNQWATILFARANSGAFSAMGIEMAKILDKKFPNLNSADKSNMQEALTYKDQPQIKAVAAKAKVIAESHLKYFYENDPVASLKYLEANKAVIKSIVAEAKKSGLKEEQEYTNKKLFEDTKNLIEEIWFENYPNNKLPQNDRAFSLLLETGLID